MAPIGDVALIFNLLVVWTSIIESAILRRWRLKIQLPSLAFCLIGVTLITKPSFIFNLQPSSSSHHNSSSALLSSLQRNSPSISRDSSSSISPIDTTITIAHHLHTRAEATSSQITRPHAQRSFFRPPSPALPQHLPPHPSPPSPTSPNAQHWTYFGYALALVSSLSVAIICTLIAFHPQVHWSAWMAHMGMSQLLFATGFVVVMVHSGGHVFLVYGAPNDRVCKIIRN